MSAREMERIRCLYDHHRWANHRLLDIAGALGEEAVVREVGTQFTAPTLKGVFFHIYGVDLLWLARWNGTSPSTPPSEQDVPTLRALRDLWSALEAEQATYLARLTELDLETVLEYRLISGKVYRLPLWTLLQHVPDHGTHHRSEIATMLTMLSGSPPGTGIARYHTLRTGQDA
ncbi:MAG: DinB family protein [Candidatus Rokuibacteriota bacterium]